MRWVLGVLACAGCSSVLGIDDFKLGDAGPGGDGLADAATDADGDFCIGPNGWRVCLQSAPTMPFTVSAAINTDTGSACLPVQPATWKSAGQPDACFVVATTIAIPSGTALIATGSRPLVLVASDTVTIAGTLDVASHTTSRGAAAPSLLCVDPALAGSSATSTSGGGAGGTFRSRAGDGGTSSAGIPGGLAAAVGAIPVTLRGGCSGGKGGDAMGSIGGTAGIGGGAVYVVAMNRIAIDGIVNASGSGGRAGGTQTGGGGAGSGGMIVLHAPAITGNGTILANGGGGGGGSGNNTGGAGADPQPSMPGSAAQGGVGGGGASGPGGGGAFGSGIGASAAGLGVNGAVGANGAGGGGGGSIGFVRTNIALVAPLVASPPATVVP